VNTTSTQKAHLSQRGRVMRRVVEYFAKLLNIIQNGTLEQADVSSSVVTMSVSCSISEIFSVK